ncbi:hypothetical protein [Flavobacterium pectinovorum]|uniref:Outer membrane protein beta-barrel domain-containing protein n=1 Tax=Flavobacterium pectinovorum TaxID=29533 RepID=A0A502EJE3_9FLAO|nr:hypothetical protein [Flavobacterium pectinovorum]TPG37818.1 hypothetical protein EAH81_17970 [Flavobacterium pectinovorum]
MKRIILSTIAVMAFGFASAQDGHFKVGAHVGLPLGNTSDLFSVNLGADVAYLWNVSDKFSAGIVTGYTTYVGKEYNGYIGSVSYAMIRSTNQSFIPVAGTAQYSITENLFVGADLGYAINVDGDLDGGFLYQPKFGYQNKKIELYAAYKGISNNGTLASLNLGFNYKF